MSRADQHVDGNAIAGLLQEILATEPTTAERVCQSCGARHPIGAHRGYRAAGVVLRCPSCGDVAARVAELPHHHVVEFSGRWVFRRSEAG
jgi:predicted RNA-binding Zn-ribbon protein involved in translation (DUF1610 family)